MFTVKHVSDEGVEIIHSALSVEVVRKGDRFEDGIFLDREPSTPDSQLGQVSKHIIQFASYSDPMTSDEAKRQTGRVYVMNANGATVGTYRL